VAALPAERTGVLVIRAWIELNGEARLRARITRMLNTEAREEISSVAATREEITSTVAEWLDAFLGSTVGDAAVTEQ
jgi:hypothetical protein